MTKNKPPIIALVGPNSAGKTALSIKLARKFNGEIISADSRQVYRGMDIGTGKATKKERTKAPHHLIDVSDPRQEYNVSHFKAAADKIIGQIYSRGRIPLLVGGTGFWIQAVIDDLELPRVKPNMELRKKLEQKTSAQLHAMLKKMDPGRAKNIDAKNPYRLIRAIEIIKATKKPVPKLAKSSPYNVLILGIKHSLPKLKNLIDRRLKKRLAQGMIAEVKKLHDNGVSWLRMESIGLEYRYISQYLRKQITKEQMTDQLRQAIVHYAKRQLTWFNKDKRIHWIKNQTQAEKLITNLLKKYADNN